MPTGTRSVVDLTLEQILFPPAAGFTVRETFIAGEVYSNSACSCMPTTYWPVAPLFPVWKTPCAAVIFTGLPAQWFCCSSRVSNNPGHHGSLPLLVFEVFLGALVTAALRPGKRPTGVGNVLIMKRVLGLLRLYWPHIYIILRGDGHCFNPELMA